MNRWLNGLRWGVGTLMLTTAVGVGGFGLATVAVGGAWGSEWGEHGEREHEEGGYRSSRSGRAPDPLYAEECGACHLPYPAHFLPARSWQAIMSGLDNHFGENAELMPETAQKISAYLAANAGDVNPGKRSKKFLRGIAGDSAPLRITETRYFKGKHEEVPDRLVTGNPDVGSFSQCQACHGEDAQRGIFDEDTVDIPGHGRWDG